MVFCLACSDEILFFNFACYSPPSEEVDLSEFAAGSFSVGAVLGAWVGACFIPLDWDRWWQACFLFGHLFLNII